MKSERAMLGGVARQVNATEMGDVTTAQPRCGGESGVWYAVPDPRAEMGILHKIEDQP